MGEFYFLHSGELRDNSILSPVDQGVLCCNLQYMSIVQHSASLVCTSTDTKCRGIIRVVILCGTLGRLNPASEDLH